MASDPSVHDNFIYGYTVDCDGRRVILHTTYRDREPNEFTDIVFDDVVAHHFEHVLPSNILFDVEEVEVSVIIRDSADLLRDSWRYGWPPIEYGGDLDVLVNALRALTIRAYSIGSSYGLSGWVLAANCMRLPRTDEAQMNGI